jgi:hypothetical protein
MAAVVAIYLARVSRVIRLEPRRLFLLPALLLFGFPALGALLRRLPAVAGLAEAPLALGGAAAVVAGCAAAFLLLEREPLGALWRRLRG